MQKRQKTPRTTAPNLKPETQNLEPEIPFSSNALRLSGRQWMVVGLITVAVFSLTPFLWERVETFELGPDYRIPYRLGDDYWMYQRVCRRMCAQDKTLVIGDSVIWGHYVAMDQALSHYLNELAGDERFANLSVDGIHPAAMAGLIKYYGRAISGKDVLLHCNLLWMSSKKHDLQTDEEFSFNHPRLVPQFSPRIPCYTESFSGRIAIVLGHNLPLSGWVNHLQVAYFQNQDLQSWTIEHPYDSPFRAVTLKLPSVDEPPSPRPIAEAWSKRRIAKFNPPWVELDDTSFQWRSFKRTIAILKRRGNRVFVLVGPFNEHMLEEEGLAKYNTRKNVVETWLQDERIAHYIPSALPSDYYADASHPLSDGYALLAKQLLDHESFIRFNSR